MEIAVASSAGKRDLVTLDLLGAEASSKDVDSAALKIAPFADLYPLDLNLGTAGGQGDAAGTTVRGCQSVCTIEKVKWALERVAERETLGGREEERRRDGGGEGDEGGDGGGSPSPSSSSSITTASIKRRREGGEEEWADGGDSAGAGGSLVATGCPSCLSYVLISKGDPRCPRCHSLVAPPHPPQHKKPRFTLNFSL